MSDYYDVSLKEYRLKQIDKCSNGRYKFIRGDIADKKFINTAFEQYRPQIVVNFAAQAGVRYSITNPDSYIQSNLIGFYNILEACRHLSRSSILFMQARQVFTAETRKYRFQPMIKWTTAVSLYVATKKSDELMTHCYSKLYNIWRQVCVSLQFTDRWDVLIWHTSALQTS